MRIGWLQDTNPFAPGGGAEMNDRLHIMEGLRRGHDIITIVGADGALELERPMEGYVISNARSFRPATFDMLLEKKAPYVMFYHDYDCRWRLFFPMQEKCKVCYSRDRWLPVHEGAKLRIWLSKLHREAWLHVYPELEDLPYLLAPSAVDPDQFFDMGLPREGAIAINVHAPFKGRDNFIQWALNYPETPVTLVGLDKNDPDTDKFPGNVTAVGRVPNFKLNELLNRHEFLVELPATPQPFNRTIAEAFLAGCNILGNDLLGALTWDEFSSRDALAELMRGAKAQWWEHVEEALKE